MTVGGRFWNSCCKPGHVVGEEGELARILAALCLLVLAHGVDDVLADDLLEELDVDFLVVRVLGEDDGPDGPRLPRKRHTTASCVRVREVGGAAL